MRLHVRSIGDAYTGICQHVVSHGEKVAPRGAMTHEVTDAVIIADQPSDSLPTGCNRHLNAAIGVAEALQLVGAYSDPQLMARISPNFRHFMDEGKFWGSYGNRIGGQVEHVVEKIKQDTDTRQAVITLWDPEKDNVVGKHDYPCTVMMTFAVRRGSLNMHVTMRSNDVWWGLAYDAFQFTQLQTAVAHALYVPVGRYHHHAVSLHAYERDFDKIAELDVVRHGGIAEATGIGRPGERMWEIKQRARIILAGGAPDSPTLTERWMISQLEKYT